MHLNPVVGSTRKPFAYPPAHRMAVARLPIAVAAAHNRLVALALMDQPPLLVRAALERAHQRQEHVLLGALPAAARRLRVVPQQ